MGIEEERDYDMKSDTQLRPLLPRLGSSESATALAEFTWNSPLPSWTCPIHHQLGVGGKENRLEERAGQDLPRTGEHTDLSFLHNLDQTGGGAFHL